MRQKNLVCRFLRFGHAIGSIQSSCTFFWGSVLRVYIRGRVTFFALGYDNQLPGGPQRTGTALRERLPQRNDAVTALVLILFCKLADVVQVLPPVAGCLKMVVVNVAANQMPGLSAVCEVPNSVTIFYPKKLFVVRINKADSLLRVIQVPVKPVLAIAVQYKL